MRFVFHGYATVNSGSTDKIVKAGSAVCIQNPDVFTCSFTQIVSMSRHLYLKGTQAVNDCILQLSLHVPTTKREVGLVCCHETTCSSSGIARYFSKIQRKSMFLTLVLTLTLLHKICSMCVFLLSNIWLVFSSKKHLMNH